MNKQRTTQEANVQVSTKEYFFVGLLWSLFQLAWFLYLGVHFELEAEKYIAEAQFILQHHHFSESRYLFYSSTIFVIAFANLLHFGLWGALFMIMLLNLFGYLCFFRAIRFFSGDQWLPYLTVFLLMSFWPFQSWTLYLYTECFFYSAVLLLFAHLLSYRELSFRYLVITFLLGILVVISRPLGILFAFPTLLFIFLNLARRQRIYFALAVVLGLVLFNYIVQTVFTTTSDWSLQKTIAEADIICNIPGPLAGKKLQLSDSPNQLYQLFYYIMHNPGHFASLAVVRLRYFFTMVRTYYSTFHNLYLVAYLLLLYAAIFAGIRKIYRFLSPALFWFVF